MKRRNLLKIGKTLALSLTICSMSARASDEVPCLVFTGESETPYLLDMSDYSRVYVDGDGFTAHSSTTGKEDVVLPYSLYTRLEFKDGKPTTGIESALTDADSDALLYLADTKSLKLLGDADDTYKIGIYNISGQLVATTTLRGGQSVSVEALEASTYVALATNGKQLQKVKFIIR